MAATAVLKASTLCFAAEDVGVACGRDLPFGTVRLIHDSLRFRTELQ